MKTKKQIKKETIEFCETFETFVLGKKMKKKDIKFYMIFHINMACEEFLEENGIKVVKEPTLKEISSYKKKVKKIKLSSKEKKIFKIYFKKKKESAKDLSELCKFLKKINMTLEEFDNIPLVELKEEKVEDAEEVKVEPVEDEKKVEEEWVVVDEK